MPTNNPLWCRRTCMAMLLSALPLQTTLGADCDAQEHQPGERIAPLLPANAIQVTNSTFHYSPRRIVIAIPENRKDRLREQDLFAKGMRRYLTERSHVSVVTARHRVCDRNSPLQTGRYDEQQLVEFLHRYQADGVLYCDVEQIRAYEPMQMEVSLLLVDCQNAVAVASGTITIDSKNSVTLQHYERFAFPDTEQRPKNQTLETHLSSPSQFIDFAAKEITAKLTKSVGF